MYRFRRYAYGPRFGRGMGYARYGPGPGFGPGRGRRAYSPYCDWYPDLPRGWWGMPEYQERLGDIGWIAPPSGARWDPYSGDPENTEAIDYEISLIEKQIEGLNKEIEHLKKIKTTK